MEQLGSWHSDRGGERTQSNQHRVERNEEIEMSHEGYPQKDFLEFTNPWLRASGHSGRKRVTPPYPQWLSHWLHSITCCSWWFLTYVSSASLSGSTCGSGQLGEIICVMFGWPVVHAIWIWPLARKLNTPLPSQPLWGSVTNSFSGNFDRDSGLWSSLTTFSPALSQYSPFPLALWTQ